MISTDYALIGEAFVKASEESEFEGLEAILFKMPKHLKIENLRDETLKEHFESLYSEILSKDKHIKNLNRVFEIVDFCFPQYNSRLPEDEKPLRLPIKEWWWNGASVIYDESEPNIKFHSNGDATVHVTSYVGGGDMNNYELRIPRGWFADDWQTQITEFIRQEKERLERVEKECKLNYAKSEIARQLGVIDEMAKSI